VHCICCQIGGAGTSERGVPEMEGFSASWCNPIFQAHKLNREKTQLNFIIGLWIGHDIII